jgi:hypothetical protein
MKQEFPGLTRYCCGDDFRLWDYDPAEAWLTVPGSLAVVHLDELLPLLARLARALRRVPPLPALFLLLGITRSSDDRMSTRLWASAKIRVEGILREMKAPEEIESFRSLLDDCRSSAQHVFAGLPGSFWVDPHRRERLTIAVFRQNARRRDIAIAESILEELEIILDQETERSALGSTLSALSKALDSSQVAEPFASPYAHVDRRPGRMRRALLELHAGLEYLANADVETLLGSRADATAEPAELDELADLNAEPEAAALSTAELLRRLDENKELRGLARLTRRCTAGLRIPMQRLDSSEDDLSGSASISNRGPLDRLLLSELANDDEQLALRVALGEALYVDHERAGAQERLGRAVLVDTGIRMWGKCRILATATALALRASAEPYAFRVYRSSSEGPVRSSFDQPSGVATHLGALDTAALPQRSLAPFLDCQPSVAWQRILITHRQVFAIPQFMRELRYAAGPGLRVLGLDDRGHIEERILTEHGETCGRTIQVDLPTHGLEPELALEQSSGLEADFYWSGPPAPKHVLCAPDGSRLIRLTTGLIVRWQNPAVFDWMHHPLPGPGKLVSSTAPSGHPLLFEVSETKIHLVVRPQRKSTLSWWSYDLHSAKEELCELPSRVTIDEHYGFKIRSAADLRLSGDKLRIGSNARAVLWTHGDREPEAAPVLPTPEYSFGEWAGDWGRGPFTRPGHPGSWIMAGDADWIRLAELDSSHLRSAPYPLSFAPTRDLRLVVSRDGKHASFAAREAPIFDLDSMQIVGHADWAPADGFFPHISFLDPDFADIYEPMQVMRRVTGIVVRDDRLLLLSRNHVFHALELARERAKTESCLTWSVHRLDDAEDLWQFTHAPKVSKVRIAKIKKRGRAMIDRNGILVLSCGRGDLPRLHCRLRMCSAGLRADISASNGMRCGDPEYVRDPNTSAEEMHALIVTILRAIE